MAIIWRTTRHRSSLLGQLRPPKKRKSFRITYPISLIKMQTFTFLNMWQMKNDLFLYYRIFTLIIFLLICQAQHIQKMPNFFNFLLKISSKHTFSVQSYPDIFITSPIFMLMSFFINEPASFYYQKCKINELSQVEVLVINKLGIAG